MRWVIWLGILNEFVILCRMLCDGILDVCGYVHGHPFVRGTDVYGATQNTWIGGCIEINKTFGEFGNFFKIYICILCLRGIVGM